MDPQQQMMIAQLLREQGSSHTQGTGRRQVTQGSTIPQELQGQNYLGMLGMVSGDRGMGAAGAAVTDGVQKQMQRSTLEDYYKAQQEQWEKNYRLKRDELDFEKSKPLEIKYNKLTGEARNFIGNRTGMVKKVGRLVDTFKPEYTKLLSGSVPGIAAFSGPLEEIPKWLERVGLDEALPSNVKAEIREAARWWKDFEFQVKTPARHETFGATLTNNEQAAFEAAMGVNGKMPPEQILNRLLNLRYAYATEARDHANSLLGQDTYPEAVYALTGGPNMDLLDVEDPGYELDGSMYEEISPGPRGAPSQGTKRRADRGTQSIYGMDIQIGDE